MGCARRAGGVQAIPVLTDERGACLQEATGNGSEAHAERVCVDPETGGAPGLCSPALPLLPVSFEALIPAVWRVDGQSILVKS